eukprot:g2472.t1
MTQAMHDHPVFSEWAATAASAVAVEDDNAAALLVLPSDLGTNVLDFLSLGEIYRCEVARLWRKGVYARLRRVVLEPDDFDGEDWPHASNPGPLELLAMTLEKCRAASQVRLNLAWVHRDVDVIGAGMFGIRHVIEALPDVIEELEIVGNKPSHGGRSYDGYWKERSCRLMDAMWKARKEAQEPPLRRLRLVGCGLGKSVNGLRCVWSRSLEVLDLTACEIGMNRTAAGGMARTPALTDVFRFLSGKPALRELRLGSNSLGDETAWDIFRAAASGGLPALETLDLSNNLISNDFLAQLGPRLFSLSSRRSGASSAG